MSLLFDLGDFIIFGHCQWTIENFEVSLGIGCDFQHVFSGKVVEGLLRRDGNFDVPWFSSRIFDGHFLLSLFSDETIEFKLLDCVGWLRDALSNQVDIKRLRTFNLAFYFEPYVVVRNVWMECYVK